MKIVIDVGYKADTANIAAVSFENWEDEQPLETKKVLLNNCLLYTSPSPRDQRGSRMPSSA